MTTTGAKPPQRPATGGTARTTARPTPARPAAPAARTAQTVDKRSPTLEMRQRKAAKKATGKQGTVEAFVRNAARKPPRTLETRAAARTSPRSAQPNLRPQLVQAKDGTYNLIRPAPPLENLILRGGGAKGVGNPPALVEMEKQGKLEGLKHVVGTSAGALTALCLASGNSAKDFEKLSDATPMTGLLKTPAGFEKRYPGLKFGAVGANGGAAVETADRASAGKAAEYLNGAFKRNSPAFQQKLDALVASENQRSPGAGDRARQRLMTLQHQDFSKDRTGHMVTFNDLRLLNQLEPGRFRQLTLTGWDEKNKRSTYFNAKDYPDMPVAVAGRISMAIPPVFSSVNVDPQDGGGRRHFADGGIGTNMPSEVVTRASAGDPRTELTGRQRENVLVRTGIMTFDEEGSTKSNNPGFLEKAASAITGKPARGELQGAYRAMHGSDAQNNKTTGVGNRISNALVGAIAGNADIGVVSQKDQQKIAESGANCFVIAHGDLGTFSLGASPTRIAAARRHATSLIREQLKQRENQAYAQGFGSVEEIYGELTPAEKAAILKGPPAPPASGRKDPSYLAELELYNRVAGD